MIYPSKKEFIALSKKGNLIPVYSQILADFDTPLSSFLKVEKGKYSFLLESVEGGEHLARYSIMGSDPSMIFKSKGRDIEIIRGRDKKKFITDKDPLFEVENIMKGFKYVPVKGLPRFSGGLVGYMGYDTVRFFEVIPDNNKDELNVPDCVFMLTDTMVIFDHVDRTIKIVSNAHVDGAGASKAYDEAVSKIKDIETRIRSKFAYSAGKKTAGKISVKSNFSRARFRQMIEKAKEYIRSGDIIQVVLSQRLSVRTDIRPFELYRALRSINPSPYMFYLRMDDIFLVGSSPEIMVRTEDGFVEVRPIAGTRPRGKDDDEDRALIKDLLNDPKEKAEHVMLVDLGRNDIGRVAEFNTVKISDFMSVERYSHVMHIVSDVSGKLRKGKNVFDVMRASFPAGTVSGAPKIRAMEIIDELENTKRGAYAGGVGYFSFSGNEDFCITIRTFVIKGGTAYIQAGAGIVQDSDPDKEYNETMNKAGALLKAVRHAAKGLE